jgi:predicted nucleotidyltransferase
MEKLGRFEESLSNVLGRKADVVLKSSVENGWNYIRRKNILSNARSIYVAR